MWISVIFLFQLAWAQATPAGATSPAVPASPSPAVGEKPESSENVAVFSWSGRVLEKGTRKPLRDVNLFLLPAKLKAVTDSQGNFKIDNVPPGPVEVVINLSGYNRFQKTFQASGAQSDLLFFVEKTSYREFETTVTDLRNKKDQTQKTLSQEEFLQVPGAGGDPVKAVQNLPGVNRTTGGDARVVIQGASPEDTRYHIEGHEVPLVFHFGGLSSIVTPEAVSSVDYFSAGYGPEFGRALGGHVGLNVRKPKTDRLHGMAFMDIFNVGGLVEGPIDETSSYLVSGRYSYVGTVFKAIAKDNKDFNLTVAPVFYDLNAQYFKRLNDTDNLRIFGILSKDELQFVLNKPIGNDPGLRGNFQRTTEFYRVIPQWSRQIDADSKVSASFGVGVNDIFFDIGDNYFRLKSQSLSVRGDYEKRLSPLWKNNWGVDNNYIWARVSAKVPSTFSSGGISNPISTGELRETDIKSRIHSIGGYWRNEIKASEASAWTWMPNLRVDRFTSTKENLLQPRLAAQYAWDPTLTLKGAAGIYHQEPEGEEFDATFGNPDIKSSRATHFTVGFEKDYREGKSEGLTLSSSLFYKNLDRLIIRSSELVSRDGALTPENYNNEGRGKIYGLELQSKYKMDVWGVTTSYTYLQSRRQNPNEAELPSPYDQTHSLNLLVSYEEGPWQYGSRLRYVTGNPYTPVIGGIYDADNDVYIPRRGGIYSERNNPFFQLDFRVDRKWIYDTWILSGYLDIQNITNQRNQEGLTYSYDYTQKQEIMGLPVLPTLGVRGEF